MSSRSLQSALHLEAVRGGDVLEIDRAEDRRDAHHRLDDLVGVGRSQADRKRVDVGELAEEHALAFHHRSRRERPDVAEPEHRRTVRDDGDGVALDRQGERLARVGGDGHGDARDARRVDGREILAGLDRDLGRDANFAADVGEEGAVRHEQDAHAVQRLDGGPDLLAHRVGGDRHRHVAGHARPGCQLHVDGADDATRVADRRRQRPEGPGTARHLQPQNDGEADSGRSHGPTVGQRTGRSSHTKASAPGIRSKASNQPAARPFPYRAGPSTGDSP